MIGVLSKDIVYWTQHLIHSLHEGKVQEIIITITDTLLYTIILLV